MAAIFSRTEMPVGWAKLTAHIPFTLVLSQDARSLIFA
jgi:hypothetical protein